MFKPRKGKDYWMVNSRFEVRQTTHTGGEKSLKRIAAGNCFKTAKEARQFKKAVMDGTILEYEKIAFDKRIAFAYGLITGFFVANMIWLAVRRLVG